MHSKVMLYILPSMTSVTPLTLFDDNERRRTYFVDVQLQTANDKYVSEITDGGGGSDLYECGLNGDGFKYKPIACKTLPSTDKSLVLLLRLSVSDTDITAATPHSTAVVPVAVMQHSNGSIQLPLLVSQTAAFVGYFEVNYILIRPWTIPLGSELISNGGDLLWEDRKKRGGFSQPLHIGHRGCGAERKLAGRLENTIASFEKASRAGADFVEFDVMLTKDGIPVVFHDYMAKVFIKQRSGDELPIPIGVAQLTSSQWSSSKIAFEDRDQCIDLEDLHSTVDDAVPFQTLEQTFQYVCPKLGFLIEVKYPMEDVNGEWEGEHRPDKNVLVDTILDTIYLHANDRKVILCCFDPEICILLRQKQSRFGVVLNCCLENTLYTPYAEKVTQTLDLAKRFAVVEKLMGLSVLVDSVIDKLPCVVKQMHEAGLAMFTWGDSNVNPKLIQQQTNSGVDGIVYDNIDEVKLPDSCSS